MMILLSQFLRKEVQFIKILSVFYDYMRLFQLPSLLHLHLTADYTGYPTKALYLINRKTNVFCSIFEISCVSDRFNINLDLDISFWKIGHITNIKS